MDTISRHFMLLSIGIFRASRPLAVSGCQHIGARHSQNALLHLYVALSGLPTDCYEIGLCERLKL